MIDIDRWQEILNTLTQHKLRTALTAFGVFWGMFMLVVLLGVGRGLERGALASFGGHTNTLFIWSAGKTQIAYKGLKKGRRAILHDEDLRMIRELPELNYSSAVNDLGGWQVDQYVVRKHLSGTFATRGLEPQGFILADYRAIRGRVLNELDSKERRKVAVIGTSVFDILFEKNENPIGELIEIAGVNFQIVGVFEAASSGEAARENSERILIPNSSLRHTFNQSSWIAHIQLSPKPGIDASILEEKAKAILFERKKVHPDDTGVFGVWNSQKNYDKVQGLFTAIRNFSWIVAIGTVIAGVVGVGNIMLIVVKERTREIGIRKALGATSYNVVGTIVQEALVLTLIAGYLGLAAGVGMLELINSLMASQENIKFGKADIEFSSALSALGALVIAGLLAAILPAMKAAVVDPIVALQDE